METRIIEQTKVYKLICNPMSGCAEETVICAISTNYDTLVRWYNEQFADKAYREDHFFKQFKKGSPLEWYNPIHNTGLGDVSTFGHGITEEWVDTRTLQEVIARGNYLFVG